MTFDADEAEGLPRFLTVQEVSDLLRLRPATTRGLLSAGDLVGFQVGDRRMWRVERSDLEAFVRKQKALIVGQPDGAPPKGGGDD